VANQLKVATVHTILTLYRQGWSRRRIAREVGVHRETVGRYIRLAEAASKPAKPAPGSGEAKPANPPPGSDGLAPPSASRSGGPASTCEPFRAVIRDKLEVGLSAKRIHQDLVAEHDFGGGYDSVKRFCRRLQHTDPLPFRRMECEPGQEAQVDFGTGAPVVSADGKRRRSHVFRIVLSHSRKAYSEAVFRQTTDDFIRCLENAFRHFGGAPKTLVIDNLKAAVTKADWYDPELNPKLRAFAAHYDTAILPTRPYTPRHKGKIERGVDYVQENGLKGHTFTSLEAQNRHLLEWETAVADTRIHGTTRKQVGKAFKDVEQPALLPLPVERFGFFHEAQRTVNRDGHIEVAKAYYSMPPEFLGRRVWVRWDGHLVRVFDRRMEQITVHSQKEPGRFSTHDSHIASEKISGTERGAAWLLKRAARIGSHTQRWAEAMLQDRGIEGVRVLQGLLSLSGRHEDQQIEQACEVAQSHGAYRLRVIRALIKRRASRQEQFEFIQDHPIIRSLSEYDRLVHAAVQGDPAAPIQECCP